MPYRGRIIGSMSEWDLQYDDWYIYTCKYIIIDSIVPSIFDIIIECWYKLDSKTLLSTSIHFMYQHQIIFELLHTCTFNNF